MPRRYTGPGAKFIYGKSFYPYRHSYALALILIVLTLLAIRIVLNQKTTIPTGNQHRQEFPGRDFDREQNQATSVAAASTDGIHAAPAEMVRVPAGYAIVGSDDVSRGQQVHLRLNKRFVDEFFIDRTEVTHQAYDLCIRAEKCTAPVKTGHLTGSNQPDRPVVVFYEQAVAYCAWAKKRLPTELEWEKAARGVDGRVFPWGSQPPDPTRGNICGSECPVSTSMENWPDPYPYMAPVGMFPAGDSPYGVTDMAGNVREWVADNSNAGSDGHVARGASWCSRDFEMMGAYRHFWNSNVREDDLGFRCAMDVPHE